MWDSCFESVKMATTTRGGGCILAHCMGLGKTLQVSVQVTCHVLLYGTRSLVATDVDRGVDGFRSLH